MEKQSWQDEATKGKDVPDWELEPMTEAGQEGAQEASVEEMPSVAETRMAELAAETQVATPENPAEKAAQIEAARAEIAEMAPKASEVSVEKKEIEITDESAAIAAMVEAARVYANSGDKAQYDAVWAKIPLGMKQGTGLREKVETATNADNVVHQVKRERNQSVNTFLAEERNKDRTLWQKITGKGKLSPEDIAHEQALGINAKVDKDQEMNNLLDISRTNTEVSAEATMEVNKGIKEELEKLGVNLEALKENGFKFDQEVLTKEKEPALNVLREKMGGAITNIFDKLAKIDKEHVVGVSVVVGLVAAMVPVLGLHDLQGVISMLPDSVSNFLQSPELAGNPLWSTITPGGESISMPSVENYMHQVDVFSNGSDVATATEGNPFGTTSEAVDVAKQVAHAAYEQDMHRMGSAFANLATIPVVMGATMYAGKIFGKIGKHFMGEKK